MEKRAGFTHLLLPLALARKVVARPTPKQRQRARIDAENAEALQLARMAVEAGLADEIPDHLLRWESKRKKDR